MKPVLIAGETVPVVRMVPFVPMVVETDETAGKTPPQ
jgi:hypothetical protein